MFSMGKMNHQYLPLFLASCFFFISLSQTSSNTSSHHHCLPHQSAHLLQLRQEFVEKNYSGYYDYYKGSYPKMKSWKADSDCCSWDGVTCDTQNGEMIGLDLSDSWLYGRLNSNSTLFSFRHLRKLNLALNNFTFSTIPSEFGQLVRLTHLNLSHSFLHGRIPSEISWLSNLVSLDLSSNNFYYVVGGDYYEKLLDLRRIDLEALVQNMTYLRELHLGGVNISSSLPQSLANLSSLTSLSLFECNLQGKFLSDIFMLPKIQTIDLSYNPKLVGFLPKFQSCSSLKELRLLGTNFSGELPSSIGNLKSLNYLDLYHTNFYGKLPKSINNLKFLNYLDLSYTKISGELPSSISNLKSLNYLLLGSSNFSGTISPSIVNLSQLTDLSLSYNNFHGQLPLKIFSELKELRYLDLSGNKVLVSKENINSSLPKFSYLSLSSCNLTEFPDFLEAQNELQTLDLSNNKIEGNIPKWFWNVGKETLSYLNLSFNLLSKFEQPLVVLPWKNMYLLDLSSNMFQESLLIPPLSTKYFFASKNKLTGSIPPMICKVRALEVLDVSNNQFIGQIPKCLLNSSNSLVVLAMSNNHFQGNLPEPFINGCSLRTLDLNRNQLQGKIPRSIVKCQMLEVLNLGNNKLNDTFPFWLESLPKLQVLVLRANGFYGPIWDPHIKFGLSKLHVIDLSYNNFFGKLPSEYFQNWSAILSVTDKDKSQPGYVGDDSNYYKVSMTIVYKGVQLELVKILTIFTAIDLSNNRFYGEIPDSVGNLKALIVLNLSSNNFMSYIPSSLGNLTELESLDLSRNRLFGEIPQQLTSLTFLEYLNLSQNQLFGQIPQAGQFLTFQSSSFEGNFGLCGFQLSKKCGSNEIPTSIMRREPSLREEFGWKVVVIGYACGLVIGLVTGHVVTS